MQILQIQFLMELNYDGTRAIDGGEGKYREGIKTGGKQKNTDVLLQRKTQKFS